MSEYIEHDQDRISVGIVEKKFYAFGEPPREMVLESGARLGPVTLAYETCGRLNADKSNAVLVTHALSGDSHVAGYYTPQDEKPGWWDNMVGPGKGIDTDRYFVICSNIIGSCMGSTGPCTINPRTVLPYGLIFRWSRLPTWSPPRRRSWTTWALKGCWRWWAAPSAACRSWNGACATRRW